MHVNCIHLQVIFMRIRFKVLKSFDEIEYESLPLNANKIKEAKNPKELYLRILPIFILVFIVLLIISSKHYYDSGIYSSSLSKPIKALSTVAFVAIGFFLHEIIHALFFPRESNVSIFIDLKHAGLYCYSSTPIKKNRYIIISIAPNIILGVLPFLLWLYMPAEDNYISALHCNFSIAMICGGIIDYYNIKNIIEQVPSNAYIQMKGWDTYFFKID